MTASLAVEKRGIMEIKNAYDLLYWARGTAQSRAALHAATILVYPTSDASIQETWVRQALREMKDALESAGSLIVESCDESAVPTHRLIDAFFCVLGELNILESSYAPNRRKRRQNA